MIKNEDWVKPIKVIDNEITFMKCRRYGYDIINIFEKPDIQEFHYFNVYDDMKGNFIDFYW